MSIAATPLVALVEAARKRRLLNRSQAERLSGYAAGKDVGAPDKLRAWLTAGDGLHPELAKKLLALLPPAEQPRLGAYQPLAHLADGGMGSVWLAAHADAPAGKDGLVVLKTIKPAPGTSGTHAEDALKRFDREGQITRQLAHPNVVRCLDAGVTDQKVMYMVLEYVDSGDLRDLVDAKGGLTEALALAILYQVADGLAEAHRLKLVHRDIKPPNIFVASNGMAKLADFGIARSTESTRTMLTMEGAIIGSPLYMSPEQILTDPTLDIRSDIYALGAVLYFCLAAEAPYGGKLQEILHQHCTAAVPDVRAKRAKLGDATQAIVNRAMAKDRAKRFQTPEELRTAIGDALNALGMRPDQANQEESTAMRPDFAQGTARSVARDIATLTADLRSQAGLDDLETIDTGEASSANQATVAANLNGDARQMTVTADLSAGPGDVTIATDLSRPTADMPTVTADLNAMATMTAVLLAEEPEPEAPIAEPRAHDPGTMATVLDQGLGTVARLLYGKETPAAPPTIVVEGDLATALAVPWISLSGGSAAPIDHPLVFLFAQHAVRMGKLREAPVDLCLRNYPVPVHKDACQRISRSHCMLRYDAVGRHCLLEDLNAPNGTRLDGIPVTAGSTVTLATGIDNIVDLAGVVVLWLRCLPRSGPVAAPHPGFAPGQVGLDTDCAFDAVAMSRPENRPEMAYAQVLRRISIGGPGADLALGGTRNRSACELGVLGGRWIWRPAPPAGQPGVAWRPLVDGTELDCGGRVVRAAPGQYPLYG